MNAIRYNGGKPRIAEWLATLSDQDILSLMEVTKWLEISFLKDMAATMAFGASKYDTDNWKKGMPAVECLNSASRHSLALARGEIEDKESKCKHAAHLAVNAMFADYMQTFHEDSYGIKAQKNQAEEPGLNMGDVYVGL